MSGQKWHLERRFDPRLHKDLPGILAKTDLDAIIELLCNSYDADAERVDVTYDPDKKYCCISDDGEGMATEQKLQRFFTRGGSTKVKERRTKKGRLRIGKFSLAASLVFHLTEVYHLETTGNGNKVTLKEDFNETEGEEYVPDPEVKKSEKDEHSTKIELLKLKRPLDLDGLVFRAARELPIMRDDFILAINGKRVYPPKIEEASIFIMDETIPGVGRVHGEFYLSRNKIPGRGGIYLKVHGRAVGDPMSPFNIAKGRGAIKAAPSSAIGMTNRVIGFVYADGLDPFISFDRSGFKEDPPEVIAVQEAITRNLGIVRKYYDDAVRAERRKVRLGRYTDVVTSVARRFDRADKEFLPRGLCNFMLSREEGYFPVEIDLASDRVIVNTAHPYFIGIRTPDGLEASLTAATAFAMARERIKQKSLVRELPAMDRAFRKGFEVFHPQGKRLVDTLFDPIVSALDKPDVIEPARLYRLEELVELTTLDRETIKELIDVGLFEEPTARPSLAPTEIEYIEGKSIRNAIRQIEGHKLLIQIVREEFPQLTTGEHLEYVDELNYELGREKDTDNYAKDIGVLKPFFIVPEARIELFRAYIQAHGMLGIRREVYSEISKDQRHMFIFSIRVPRQYRDNPEEYYKTKVGFVDSYLKRDIGARVNAHYLKEQCRIVGTVLSFEQALLRRAFGEQKYEQQNSTPAGLFEHEFKILRTMVAGQNRFDVLEETPEVYRELLLH